MGKGHELITKYGTNNYLLWGLTDDEIAAGRTSLSKSQRKSRDPMMNKFLNALNNGRHRDANGVYKVDSLAARANFMFDLNFPHRGNAAKTTIANAAQKRQRQR